jgi:hypothetical protein
MSKKAIEINSLNYHPFPINIDYSEIGGIYKVFLCPISVSEIIEILPFKSFLIFDVDHQEYGEEFKYISLAEIAEKYSTIIKDFDNETILMKKQDFIRLIDEINHYNLKLIDAQENIELEKVIQIIDLAEKLDESSITNETGQAFFLSSHDDCYLYFETKDKNLTLDLISLQIKTLVTTISDCSFEEMSFDPKELTEKEEFSIMISQSPTEERDKIIWKIYNSTFKEYVYESEKLQSDSNLIFDLITKEIRMF